jgi:hypothetical protein
LQTIAAGNARLMRLTTSSFAGLTHNLG